MSRPWARRGLAGPDSPNTSNIFCGALYIVSGKNLGFILSVNVALRTAGRPIFISHFIMWADKGLGGSLRGDI